MMAPSSAGGPLNRLLAAFLLVADLGRASVMSTAPSVTGSGHAPCATARPRRNEASTSGAALRGSGSAVDCRKREVDVELGPRPELPDARRRW